jgi:hypothetical protein
MEERGRKKGDIDPNALVQEVLRESYLESVEDLRSYAEKVRYFNKSKQAVRRYLAALRDYKARVISAARERHVDLCGHDGETQGALAKIFEEQSRPCKVGDLEHELCISDRMPRAGVDNFDVLTDEIKKWEEKLNSIGDDAQLANVDLQNILQKQQQALQMMSNISKMLYDSAMSVIRKIGG